MSSSKVSAIYKTAFVTGSSTGLGSEFSKILLEEGVEVWGTSRSIHRLKALERFHPVELELENAESVEAVFRKSERDSGGFDIVINNAGFGVFGEFSGSDFDIFRRQIQVMLLSYMKISHLSLPYMIKKRRGALVNISSLAGEFPLPYQATYNLTKAGLSAFSESLMIELIGSGVSVIDFRLGDYRTDFENSLCVAKSPESPNEISAWEAFHKLMKTGPHPRHAALRLKKALLDQRSSRVRSGRFFQAVLAPLLARFGTQTLLRAGQRKYYGLS